MFFHDMNFALHAKKPGKPNGLKTAVVGAGPAGLSAAGYLVCRGFRVHVYDKMPMPGGLMMFGIPDFRLRVDRVDTACHKLFTAYGAVFRGSTKICGGPDEGKGECIHEGDDFCEHFISLPQLRKDYDSVLLSTGSWRSRRLNVPGDMLAGVYSGLGYLFPQRGMVCDNKICCPDVEGKKVVIIGAGLSAVDAARCALGMNAAEVHMLYRRTMNEAPAGAYEIKELVEEGMIWKDLAAPVRIIGTSVVEGLEYIQCTLGEPDESGRRCPLPEHGSNTIIEADIVVSAIGELPTLPDEAKLGIREVRNGGTAWPRMTRLEGVFVAGDALTGPSKIGWAITGGLEAARSMERWMGRALED